MRLRFVFALTAGLAAISMPFSTANARRIKVGDGPNSVPTIQQAIDAAQTGDVIKLASVHTYTENVQLFPPVAAKELTIVGGPNTRINGGGLGCVVQIDKGYSLRLSGVFVVNGKCQRGGGIANSGKLILQRVTISGNEGTQGGGGIFNDDGAVLIVNRTVLSANKTTDPSGTGGGILNFGAATVSESEVKGNSAAQGAGIENHGGNLHLVQMTVSGNTAIGNGGGLDDSADSQNAPFTALQKTLVTKNTATSGGGIFSGAGKITLANSIVRQNAPDNCAPAGSVGGCVGSPRGHRSSSDVQSSGTESAD